MEKIIEQHTCAGRTDGYGGFTCVRCGKYVSAPVRSPKSNLKDVILCALNKGYLNSKALGHLNDAGYIQNTMKDVVSFLDENGRPSLIQPGDTVSFRGNTTKIDLSVRKDLIQRAKKECEPRYFYNGMTGEKFPYTTPTQELIKELLKELENENKSA